MPARIYASAGTLADQAKVAGTIYKGFGRWSSGCSALACWASIVAMPSGDA